MQNTRAIYDTCDVHQVHSTAAGEDQRPRYRCRSRSTRITIITAGRIGQTVALFAAMAVLLSMAGNVSADSIHPSLFEGTVPVGGSTPLPTRVTVNAGPPTTAKVDVFFLADTTGSMGSAINSVRAGASTILSTTANLGDVWFGVGEYKDIGDTFVYRTNTGLTMNQSTVQAGLNLWGASGGGDVPEANLFGLDQAATTIAWRTGSRRLLAWFGDAPGHDPSNGITEAQAITDLVTQSIGVEALDVGALNATGQAARITEATGGHLWTGVAASNVATAIQHAITTAVSTYTSVCLSPSAPVEVGVALAPACITGLFDRSIDRTFDFDVTLTGLQPGDHVFHIAALVDGGTVATEHNLLHVTAVPEPSAVLLMVSGLGALIVMRRKRLSHDADDSCRDGTAPRVGRAHADCSLATNAGARKQSAGIHRDSVRSKPVSHHWEL